LPWGNASAKNHGPFDGELREGGRSAAKKKKKNKKTAPNKGTTKRVYVQRTGGGKRTESSERPAVTAG